MATAKPPASVTTTVTVNAAFLQEIKEVNQELWELLDRLRYRVNRPPQTSAERRQFEEQIEQLRDAVALHFALEEAYGYFDDPIGVAPHLCDSANRLRSEHQELYLDLSRLADYIHELHVRGRLARHWNQVSQMFQQFSDQLNEHEAEEEALILQAYDEDIGVGD